MFIILDFGMVYRKKSSVRGKERSKEKDSMIEIERERKREKEREIKKER
jgi:hypothetical protein